jgi:hypothetical protein
MRTIIAGSRGITCLQAVRDAVNSAPWTITEVVSGTARGVDRLGEKWADENGLSVTRFPANWDTHGRRAGYLRNEQMANYAEALLALWDGESKGTKHMIDIAVAKGLRVFVAEVK